MTVAATLPVLPAPRGLHTLSHCEWWLRMVSHSCLQTFDTESGDGLLGLLLRTAFRVPGSHSAPPRVWGPEPRSKSAGSGRTEGPSGRFRGTVRDRKFPGGGGFRGGLGETGQGARSGRVPGGRAGEKGPEDCLEEVTGRVLLG